MGMGRTDQRRRTLVEIWFAIAAVMLTAYVLLDGLDLGAGAVHLFVARSDGERRQVLGAIGPFWDGNEVWLLAAGGALFVAFPPVLASGRSGVGRPRPFFPVTRHRFHHLDASRHPRLVHDPRMRFRSAGTRRARRHVP